MDIRQLFQQQSEKIEAAERAKKLQSKKRARKIIESDSEDDEVVLTSPKSKVSSKPSSKEDPALIPITPSEYFKKYPSKKVIESKQQPGTKSITVNEADSTTSPNAGRTKPEAVPPAKKQRTESHSQESSQSAVLAEEVAGLEIHPKTPTSPTPKATSNAALATPEHTASSAKKSTPFASKTPLVRTTSSNASSYFAYMNRSGPANLGTKEIPSGADNCLGNLTFVITGVLDSLEREEAKDLIQRYGGRVVGSLSKKVTHLVVGLEAGESKLARARELGAEEVDEDQLLDMIRTRPAAVAPPTGASSSKRKSKSAARKSNTSLDISTTSEHPETYKIDTNQPTPSQSQPREDIQMDIDTVKPKPETALNAPCLLLVDKYRPTCVREMIGGGRDASPANKLMKWLREWFSVNRAGAVKESKGGFFNKNPSNFKAVLLSGPPGIGKTTAATLACGELGLSYVELNASSTRSKSSLEESVAQMLTNTTLLPGAVPGPRGRERHVLIMDEVDGMAGNEDRGGVQELTSLIKTTKIPIICICNDRQHQKMRTLVHYCYDLPVSRPDMEQIKTAMLKMTYREGIKIPPNALEEIIVASNHDIRQVIHNISMWTADKKVLSYEDAKSNAQNAKKIVSKGPFDVIKHVFSRPNPQANSIDEKMDLFFQDYSIGPLFVQENYPLIRPLGAKGSAQRHLELMALAAESISTGDIVSKRIRTAQSWKLLPIQGFFSTVLPGQILQGTFAGRIEFPKWLGNNSKCTKYQRIIGELSTHTRIHTSGSNTDLSLDYVPSWYQKVTRALTNEEIQEASSFLCEYELLKEDWDSISELGFFKGHNDIMSQVPPKVKAQLTRITNKERGHVHYRIDQSFRKQKVLTEGDYDEIEVDEGNSEGDSQDLSQNQMIQVKNVPVKKPAAPKTSGKGAQKGKRVKK